MIEETEETPDRPALLGAVGRELEAMLARPLAPGLYLVSTPIGNLGDISLRALAILANCELLYCEDTRHSRKLLDRYGLRRALRSLHDHNEDAEQAPVLRELAAGRSVAVISDAGTPLISDPGFKLVRAAAAAGHAVLSVPGASAVLASIASSGLPSDCFTFAGFLPSKANQRAERLRELAHVAGTLIFFEAPGRVEATLTALRGEFGDDCPAAVARELTKLHEETRRGTLGELALWAQAGIRGEIVIAVAPTRTAATRVSDEEILAAIEAETSGSIRDRILAVAASLHASRKRVYDLVLRSRKD